MKGKYSKEELAAMSDEEFAKAMKEIQLEAENKGRERLKNQIARRERLLSALNELWKVYQEHGSGKLKQYIKDDLDRVVKASVDDVPNEE